MPVRRARTGDEVAAALAVREAAFVDQQGIDPATDRDGADRLVGRAQASALSLFRAFGFTVDGESFTEAGIEHHPVVYDL